MQSTASQLKVDMAAPFSAAKRQSLLKIGRIADTDLAFKAGLSAEIEAAASQEPGQEAKSQEGSQGGGESAKLIKGEVEEKEAAETEKVRKQAAKAAPPAARASSSRCPSTRQCYVQLRSRADTARSRSTRGRCLRLSSGTRLTTFSFTAQWMRHFMAHTPSRSPRSE